MKNIKFGYFSEAEAEQYNFYRVPKALFTEEYFKGLSCEAKILYGLMLDRISLSIKNQWFDSRGRAYIIFTVADVMSILGCQSQKAVRLMKELDASDGIGLIEKKRIGLGRPNIIYVKNFMAREDGGGQKADDIPGGFSGNCASVSRCKDSLDRGEDVCESLCSRLDADASLSHSAKKAGADTAVAEIDQIMETDGQIQSGGISEMEEYLAGDAAQDQEMGRNIEKDWWTGGTEIPETAGDGKDDAPQDEADWWMLETHAADEAFDRQSSAVPECLSEAGGIGIKCGKQGGMGLEAGYAGSVDTREEESRAGAENQISGRTASSFVDGMSGIEIESADGAGKDGTGAAGCMPGNAAVLQNARMQDAGERPACNTGKYEFRDREIEAMWRSVFGKQPDREDCERTKLPEGAGQEFSKKNFQCSEMQDSGLVSGRTAEFRNAECNDTDTSDTENISKIEKSEKKDIMTDLFKSHQSCQSYQSYQSYQPCQSDPVCQPEKKEACCAGKEKTETDGKAAESMAGQLSWDQENDSVKGRMDSYREAIRDNISYPCFQDGRSMEDVDELVELMVDTMMVPDGCTIRIAGMDRPASVVKGCFMKLVHSHIEYVVDCLQKHTGKIWNIKAYLLTSLYNSALTISSYYRAEVNHDLYGY